MFYGLAIPSPKSSVPFNSAIGISDFGPFPADMMRRNSLRGPGAWNFDASLHKTFPITERMGLEFGAEGINVFNHHNYYVNTTALDDPGITEVQSYAAVWATSPKAATTISGGSANSRCGSRSNPHTELKHRGRPPKRTPLDC